MLQIAFLRQHTAKVITQLKVKYFAELHLVDEVLQLDDNRKKIQFEAEELLAKINSTSKEIGMLMQQGQQAKASSLKQQIADYKIAIEPLKTDLKNIEEAIYNILVRLPNVPSTAVPQGKTPEDNVVVSQSKNIPELSNNAVPHWDLARQYSLIDFELGNKITGSGFPVYINQGAKLQRALIQYFLDFNTKAGYIEYATPFMVNSDSAYGTGQLPDKEGQMYYVVQDELYLIPTSEVPLTNIWRDIIVKEEELPIKMTAYSPCFRREAGSYGKDVRGLNRVHQFDKVEIVQIVHPDKSYTILEEMVAHVEKLLQTLELPYRLLKLCGGDMSFASALTYDFEVYSAAQKRWLEVSSVSNFESFQSNRMKTRYKDATGKTQLVHTLNGSSLALPRIVAALLENNQTPKGISLPSVLHAYMAPTLAAN